MEFKRITREFNGQKKTSLSIDTEHNMGYHAEDIKTSNRTIKTAREHLCVCVVCAGLLIIMLLHQPTDTILRITYSFNNSIKTCAIVSSMRLKGLV